MPSLPSRLLPLAAADWPAVASALRGCGGVRVVDRAEGEPEGVQQGLAGGIVDRRGDDRDVHAAGDVDLVVIDLGEHGLVVEPERVVASSIPRLRRQAPEVTDAGDGDGDEPVEELPHAVTAERHLGADRLALAE